MRLDARADANQPEIVAALRKAGCVVQHLHMVGHGCPDLLVAIDGIQVLLEIKMPGERLNEVEAKWHAAWPGEVHVVYSAQDALDVMGL